MHLMGMTHRNRRGRRVAFTLVTVAALSLAVSACSASASNQARAQGEADRLVSLASVPSGSVARSDGPPALAGPAMGIANASSVVDTVRFWQVKMPYAASLAWIRAHPPAGLRLSGSSSGSGPAGATSAGFSYGAPDSDAWVQAQLEISLAPQGPNSTTWRVDGVALWLDPEPLRDDRAGQRLRVTVAKGCPASDAHAVGVSNTGDDLDQSLLPTEQPTAALTCSYSGPNGKPFALATRHLLPQASARHLAAVARQVSLSHADDGVTHCPLDDGSVTVLAFSYSTRPDVDLWYAPSGCPFVGNGKVLVQTFTGLEAFAQATVAADR